ncbi:SEC10/PgrA surface exclusion domain-containing protein [Lactobacillus taiwanensis]|uniref:SEC10/PgrA surface exclusion domain-containing protein n=1 Tax=Lactobacillus taiwanensis TaxID=508451 RepID=UPI001FD4EE6A|nr:SEC10/PgrA surface exclusion domain-containing protein [Lactobacillus taiwanensis]
MKNKDKLLYVSAAVLAAGSVAGVKTTNVKAAEVKQANVNSKLDLNNATQEKQAVAQDKTAQGQIKQDTDTVQKTQDQLKQDQAAKTQAESAKTEAQNTLPAKENAVSNAQTKLDNAKQELTQTEAQNKDLHAQYDTTTENAVHTAQDAEKKLDQKVNDLSGQVQDTQNKQTDLLGQRTNAESEIKTNTETLNNVNEQLNKAQADSAQAQKHFDNVQKDYAPIQNEYNAKKSAADKAAQDLKQNETNLAQSQKQLADLQTKTDLNQSQAKLNDIQKQNSDVNGKLTSAIAKRDQAKSALDSQSENQTKIVITPEFNKAFHKWNDNHDPNYVQWTPEKDAEMVKELGDLSKQERAMNHFEHNAKDKEHKIDMMHLTYEERLDANKFGINLVNQIRTQMGKQPVKLTVGSLKYANDVAKYYEADHPADSFANGNVDGSHPGHDTKAINKALVENGVKPGMGGEAGHYGTYYDSDLDGRFGSFSIKNMDDLKQNIYNAVTKWMFNYEQGEWEHASIVTSMSLWDNTNYKNHNEEDPTYFGFAIMANAPHEELGGISGDLGINLETIIDNTIPGNPLSHPIDYNKFNVKDVIPTDNSDSSQAGQVYAVAQNEVNALQGQKTDLDNQIKSLNDHIAQSQTRVNDLTKTITDLSVKLANAKTEQGTVQGQIGQVSKHVDALKAAQPALIQARDNTINALADYEQTHATVLNDYNNAKSQLDQANN